MSTARSSVPARMSPTDLVGPFPATRAGHYYWDRLILDTPRLPGFRQLFGDERADYQGALDQHYQHGPAPNWGK